MQRLPITVEVLSQTGVGMTVNAFRRDPGPVGETSCKLISRWKRSFEGNKQREKLLKAERAAERAVQRDKKHRHERSHERDPERSLESSVERSASPAGTDDSENGMEIDEARALEEQRERERAEAEAEAARQAEMEVEKRAKEEEKRRRREERAKREAAKDGVVVKEEPRVQEEHRHHSSKELHSGCDKERHRKEGKHRRHEGTKENGHCSEPPTTVVKEERTEARTNGRAEDDRSHHSHHRSCSKHSSSAGHSSSADKHSSSSEHHSSSGEKHHSSGDKHQSFSEKHHSSSEKHHSSGDKHSSSSEKHSSKNRSRGDESSSSKSHHKSRSNGALDAGHGSSSSKKSSHADGENDASREARRSKHKSSKHDKHEKRRGKSEKKEENKPVRLREFDFLSQLGGNDSDADQGGSFVDALGGSDSVTKKNKSKSSSQARSSANSAHAPAMALDPPRPSGKRALDEEEALSVVLTAKHKRTKVYSGARSAGWARVPTLMDICLWSLSENIAYLEYTGGVPYEILRPVLEKCTADQLRDIEYHNPYLMDDTDDLWQTLVKKEFRCERREEMETWREMHVRCLEEHEQKYNKLRSMIEAKRKESLASSRKTKVSYEYTVVKPPRITAKQLEEAKTTAALRHLDLATYDNERSDLTHRLLQDKTLELIPSYKSFVELFVNAELIRWAALVEMYEAPLRSGSPDCPATDVFSETEAGKKRWEQLKKRCVEHNIDVMSRYYRRVRLSRMAQLLELTEAETEEYLSQMVVSGAVQAKTDRLEGIVSFIKTKNPTDILTEWSSGISSLMMLVTKTTHLINKEEMVHKHLLPSAD